MLGARGTLGLATFIWVEVVSQGILRQDLISPARNWFPGHCLVRYLSEARIMVDGGSDSSQHRWKKALFGKQYADHVPAADSTMTIPLGKRVYARTIFLDVLHRLLPPSGFTVVSI
jgi:hypothetical protein